MAYFNHAFQKLFLATGFDQLQTSVRDLDGNSILVDTQGALVTTAGVPSIALNELSAIAKSSFFSTPLQSGYVGIFDPKTHRSFLPETECCPIYIAGSAIYANDKIGSFHGGYQETNKSKVINPKYVSRLYTQEACPASNEVVNIGATPYNVGGVILVLDGSSLVGGTGYANGTSLATVTSANGTGATVEIAVNLGVVTAVNLVYGGFGYEPGEELTITGGNGDATINVDGAVLAVTTAAGGANCCKEFLCDETYSLRIDIKGSPVLRFLNRHTYLTVEAYTGCCPDDAIAPTPVDSTLVFIEWAKQIVNSPLISPFLKLVVIAEDGTVLYDPSTSATDLAQIPNAVTWDQYISAGHIEGACAGIILEGAYVDTKFGDCTFQTSDFFEKEPVKIYASLVDMNGDPCEFEDLCVVKECEAKQAEGFGEQVMRNFVLSESYRQNFLHSDLRIREITQGNQMLDVIDRSAQYDRLYLLHSVPRFNNPSSTFDNDQYLLEFVGLAGSGSLTALIDTLTMWLEGCGVCELEAFECSAPCIPIIAIPPFVERKRQEKPRPPFGL
jgi:hypothetical protein